MITNNLQKLILLYDSTLFILHKIANSIQRQCIPMDCFLSITDCQWAITVVKTIPRLQRNKILSGLGIVAYIDDIGIWSNGTYEDHFQKVNEVLWQLAAKGLWTNLWKCEWAVENPNCLVFDMSPTHCKSMKKKLIIYFKFRFLRTRRNCTHFAFYQALQDNISKTEPRPCSTNTFEQWCFFHLKTKQTESIWWDEGVINRRLFELVS